MDYDEAKKVAMSEVAGQARMKIRIGGTTLILPHKQSIEFIKSLELAEEIEDSWSVPSIKSLPTESLTITPLSHKEYCHLKMAQLLDVSPYDIERMEREKKIAGK